jgi:hypothetical protein
MLSGARQARRDDPAAVTGAKYEDGLVIIDLYNWRGQTRMARAFTNMFFIPVLGGSPGTASARGIF